MFKNLVFKIFFIFFAFSFLIAQDSFAMPFCDCDSFTLGCDVTTEYTYFGTYCEIPSTPPSYGEVNCDCRLKPSPICPAPDNVPQSFFNMGALAPPPAINGTACGSGGTWQCRITASTGAITVNWTCWCAGCPPPSLPCANPFGVGPDIPHGGSITAYQSTTVSCGDVCISETRTCNNGVLSGSYTNQNCSVNACPPPPTSCELQTQTFQIQQLAFPDLQIVLPHSAVACSGDGSSTTIVPGRINQLPFNLSTISASLVVSGDANPHTLQSIPTELTYTWHVATGGPASCPNPFGVGPDIPHGGSTPAYQTSSVSCGDTCVSEVRVCNNGILSGGYNFPACSPAACANCTNPFGGADIPHGGTVTAYQASSVTCGNTCNSEVRTCNNGTLSPGTYSHASCSVGPCGCKNDGDICKLAGMCGGGPESVDDCATCCSMTSYNVPISGCLSDQKVCGTVCTPNGMGCGVDSDCCSGYCRTDLGYPRCE